MGLARPRFDRKQFDGWSHEKMVDAYIGARMYAMDLEAEVIWWKKLAESREEPRI